MYYENSHFLIVHLLMLLYTFWNTQQWTLQAVFLHYLFNQKLFREVLHDVKQSHMLMYGECKQARITVVNTSRVRQVHHIGSIRYRFSNTLQYARAVIKR